MTPESPRSLPPPSPAGATPTGSPLGGDWPATVSDRIESVVGSVRDKTTKPIQQVAIALVYGLILGTLGATVLFLLIVAGIRALDVYLPFHPIGRRVWVVDAAASAIFLLAGAFLWRRRLPRHT